MKLIAVIPARSGSKGLPDKNIKELNGKPLLAYSIECAINSNAFDEVMVSTDSEKYASIAMNYGASVPFLRSPDNSGDKSSSWDAVYEVLEKYRESGREFDGFMLLQPTSPLRQPEDIVGAIEEYESRKADAIVSVCEAEHSPLYTNVLPDDLSMSDFFGEIRSVRRQDLQKFYRLNGAIYLSQTQLFMDTKDIYSGKTFAYIMPDVRSVDIDTEIDFLYAETLLKHYTKL
ncbi:CMP-N,N'-diacetyllegionaminic acid synthase [Lachnospiraceae bacterium XBB2008]|nr:CMP-N,N'-diacetyllegionaminic acid synthase [Lachnospiraceae bacterium XBB2008]